VQGADVTPVRLRERLARHPRVSLIHGPTPLEEYPRLAALLGVPRLFVKRDDLTGLALGGNKVRELEFFLGDALAHGCDVFVAGGGVGQSNHARQCAAAARRVGMDVELVLRRGHGGTLPTGNLLITALLGADITWVEDDPGLQDRDLLASVMDHRADILRRQGRTPFVLHSSFDPRGALGYVDGALELLEQTTELGVDRFTLYMTSMGATRVGVETALEALELERTVTVRSAGWRPVDADLGRRLAELAHATARLVGSTWEPGPDHFRTIDAGGPAYGQPSVAGLDALALAARTEGLLLDPVYTSKGFAGMIDDLAKHPTTHPVVFLHTGGVPALFAYADDLDTNAETHATTRPGAPQPLSERPS